AASRTDEEIERILEEAADRYGPLPDSVLNLADYGRIRVMADRLGIEAIDRDARVIVLRFRPQAKLDPVRLVSLVRQRPELTLVPPGGLKFGLDGPESMPRPMKAVSGSPSRRRSAHAPSWWVARARETEVKPGFTKAEMTKPAAENPRAPGGLFERVGGLLSDLIDQG
ncbi:MAG TPA: TRCF domain-containing protein, partial [Vicinamibacterales bacterium]